MQKLKSGGNRYFRSSCCQSSFVKAYVSRQNNENVGIFIFKSLNCYEVKNQPAFAKSKSGAADVVTTESVPVVRFLQILCESRKNVPFFFFLSHLQKSNPRQQLSSTDFFLVPRSKSSTSAVRLIPDCTYLLPEAKILTSVQREITLKTTPFSRPRLISV